jgi:hypothetical protein
MVAAVVAALCMTAPALAQSGLEERRGDAATLATSEIEAFTGPVERHCGIFTLPAGLDGPAAADRKEIVKALRCIRDAQRRGRAAWAVWQVAGVDATVFDGLAATAVSDVQLVQGEGSGGIVRLQPCLRPRVQKDATIACANARSTTPLSPGDLKAALSKLERDVERTAGKEFAPVVARLATQAGANASPSDPGLLPRVVGEVQRAVHDQADATWPACPRHFAQALEFRDQRWFCARDRAFIADLGGLWKVLPRRR